MTDATDAVCAAERVATIVQGPAQEAAEGLDGRRYAFVNGYGTNYIVGGTRDRCGEYFYKFEYRGEKKNERLNADPRLEDASINCTFSRVYPSLFFDFFFASDRSSVAIRIDSSFLRAYFFPAKELG